jgi:hypothetical protein
VSRHLDCPNHGSMELDPDARSVQCDGCKVAAEVWQTTFHCVCGRQFTADEVEKAIREIISAATLLAVVIEQNRRALEDIRRLGNDSARSWLLKVVEGIGGSLGTAVGSLLGWIARFIF